MTCTSSQHHVYKCPERWSSPGVLWEHQGWAHAKAWGCAPWFSATFGVVGGGKVMSAGLSGPVTANAGLGELLYPQKWFHVIQ